VETPGEAGCFQVGMALATGTAASVAASFTVSDYLECFLEELFIEHISDGTLTWLTFLITHCTYKRT